MKKKNKEKSLFESVFGTEETKKPEDLSPADQETMEYYQQIKEGLETEISDDIRQRLAEKVPAYNLKEVIRLFPAESNSYRKNEVRLAAASDNLKPGLVSLSFFDREMLWLVKINKEGNEKAKVYLFSAGKKEYRSATLTLQPEGKVIRFGESQNLVEDFVPDVIESVLVELEI
ncbi:MAG: hypothetical protein L6Q59_16060 [Ignavibacteriaceae bacterium]|nr:hypothetical protein [Ignavibacteriaceae bacterium]